LFMKTNVTVEYAGKQYEEKDIIQKIKDAWVDAGKKIKEIKSLNIYIKPEETAAYYVINDVESGKITL
ncbi:MAG: hypothetical protein HFI32_14705, partial [Lachnospiraceae bacterium]|nr:hypothetical protein [Lachnospiraceae bacterium]